MVFESALNDFGKIAALRGQTNPAEVHRIGAPSRLVNSFPSWAQGLLAFGLHLIVFKR